MATLRSGCMVSETIRDVGVAGGLSGDREMDHGRDSACSIRPRTFRHRRIVNILLERRETGFEDDGLVVVALAMIRLVRPRSTSRGLSSSSSRMVSGVMSHEWTLAPWSAVSA